MSELGRHKKQFFLTLVVICCVGFLAWKFAFSRTCTLLTEVNQMEQKLGLIEDAPLQQVRMKERLEQLENLIGSSGGNLDSEHIIESVSNYLAGQEQLVLCALPPVHCLETSDYRIETFVLELKGNYHALVQFMNFFELHREIGRYASAEFFTIQNRETKQKELHLKLYIQSFTRK